MGRMADYCHHPFLSEAVYHLFIVCPGFYMGRIHEDLTWVYQFKFITFLQYMGKYLLKKASVLKTAGIVFSER